MKKRILNKKRFSNKKTFLVSRSLMIKITSSGERETTDRAATRGPPPARRRLLIPRVAWSHTPMQRPCGGTGSIFRNLASRYTAEGSFKNQFLRRGQTHRSPASHFKPPIRLRDALECIFARVLETPPHTDTKNGEFDFEMTRLVNVS